MMMMVVVVMMVMMIEITLHEREGNTEQAKNPLTSLLEGVHTGLGIGVQREEDGASSFLKAA